MPSYLPQLLLRENIISESQYRNVLDLCEHSSTKAIQVLVEQNVVEPNRLTGFLCEYFSLDYFTELPEVNIPHNEPLNELLILHHVVPIEITPQSITLAISDPTDNSIEEDFSFASARKVKLVLTDWSQIENWLQHYFNQSQLNTITHSKKYPTRLANRSNHKLLQSSENIGSEHKTDIAQYLHDVLQFSLRQNASDIHFEPLESEYRIRIRIDGILTTFFTPHHAIGKRIITRLKVFANLDIAEQRLPQDGHFSYATHKTQSLDLRVSTLPTLWGEKAVLRLLNTRSSALNSRQLGMSMAQLEMWRNALNRPQGLILVTGPTGSGKTFTLYTGLSELDTQSKNISTIEDPIEIQLKGINQVQANANISLSFSAILRAMLRQDPDVIMVGEIRDNETAAMAFQAAQTGHLVISTLHSNSALDSLSRLKQLGIAEYQMRNCINLIVAQRLVRKLCPVCKIAAPVPPQLKDIFKLHKQTHLFCASPSGCKHCHKGYSGRTGLFEMLSPPRTNTLPLSLDNQDEHLKMTLWQSGLNTLCDGQTSVSELMRVLDCAILH